MTSLLQKIIEHKHNEIKLLNAQNLQHDLDQRQSNNLLKSFKHALSENRLSFIGELSGDHRLKESFH